MHVSIEDLPDDACEFDNMSNDRKHPAEPSISLLLVLSTLSPCHFLVVVNLNRLDQEIVSIKMKQKIETRNNLSQPSEDCHRLCLHHRHIPRLLSDLSSPSIVE